MSLLRKLDAPIGESRISVLEPGAKVHTHVDVEFYWKHRFRVHIVLQSNPKALFGCGKQTLNLPVGQLWVSNNWAPHWIANQGTEDRIHIVVDTVGSPTLWNWIERGWHSDGESACPTTDELKCLELPTKFTAQFTKAPLETYTPLHIRHPAEVHEIIEDAILELTTLDTHFPHSPTADRLRNFTKLWHNTFQQHKHSQRQQFQVLFDQLICHLPNLTLPNTVSLHTVLHRQIGASIKPIPNVVPIVLISPMAYLEDFKCRLQQTLDGKSKEVVVEEHIWTDWWCVEHEHYSKLEELSTWLRLAQTNQYWIDLTAQAMTAPLHWFIDGAQILPRLEEWLTLFPNSVFVGCHPNLVTRNEPENHFAGSLANIVSKAPTNLLQSCSIHVVETSMKDTLTSIFNPTHESTDIQQLTMEAYVELWRSTTSTVRPKDV